MVKNMETTIFFGQYTGYIGYNGEENGKCYILWII